MKRALEIITFPPTPGPLHMLCSLPPTFSSVYTHISPFPGLCQVLQEALLVVLALVGAGCIPLADPVQVVILHLSISLFMRSPGQARIGVLGK